MTTRRCRRSVHLFGSNRLDETLLDSFTQVRGIEADYLKDPMSAMSEHALSLWTLPMTLGIRTSSAEASGHCGRWTRNNASYLPSTFDCYRVTFSCQARNRRLRPIMNSLAAF